MIVKTHILSPDLVNPEFMGNTVHCKDIRIEDPVMGVYKINANFCHFIFCETGETESR
jgi:hypothetical protein